MRTFTKSLVTLLLLLVVGSLSAQTLKVLDPNGERDWSKQADGDYPYYFDDGWIPTDALKEVVNGALHLYNPEVQGSHSSFQLFVLDWFNTTQDEDYVIRIWMKADGAGTANLVVGTWGGSASSTFDFEQSDDFKMYQIAHTAGVTSTENNEHILFQCGTFAGNIEIQKVQILQMGEDKPTLSSWGTWTPLINNSDMEGDDVSSFFAKIDRDKTEPVPNAVISDGVGVDGSRGILVAATAKVDEAWDNQFWFRFNQPLEVNTQYRVKFDYKADLSGDVATQAHAAPGDYIHYELLGNISFTGDWQTYEKNDLKVTSSQAKNSNGNKYQSVAFNLNDIQDANNYYFDNIYVDAYEPQIDVQYGEGGCIKVLFPYYVNTCRLMVKYSEGKRRLIIPNEMFTVTVNGKTAEFESVEIDATGALYAFISEEWASENDCEYLGENDEVIVTFNNLEGDYNISNLDTEETVAAFTQNGRFVEDLQDLPFTYGAPEMMSSDPEEGSFNLANTINEFKVTFDKKVIVNKIVAKLDDEALTAEAAEEFATEVTLKRTGTKALEDGAHKITITKVYGQYNLGENDYSTSEINISVGAQVSQDLLDQIAAAQTALTATSDARYAGTAYNNLEAAIAKYTAEAPTYTAPSVIDAAMVDLSNLVKALNAHKTLVDDYDAANQKIQDLATDLAESKFNGTDLYQQLKTLAEKYAGKELTDDEELTAANNELKPMADLCANMFTEGISNNGDAGFKVLTERIRRGVEALKNFGYDDEDPLIVAANNLISDDDAIADQIKAALTKKVYEGMKDPATFFPVLDVEEDGEGNLTEVKQTYDMSVFIKNPNMYAKLPKNGWSEENTPGWVVVKGNPGFWGNGGDSWGNPRNIEGLPEDIAVTVYHSEAQVEQTITDLPAGIYTVTLYGTDWGNQKGDYDDETGEWSGKDALGFVYAKVTDTPEPAEGETADRDINFAATATIEAAKNHGLSQYSMDLEHKLSEITVTDGKLTIGFYYGNDSQYFFGDAKLTLTGAAAGFDYAAALETNIDQPATAKVRALQLYDLNGRRIATAQKGIQIVKKMMSDGTVKTQKVVK